ncbi:MAG: hypothetical protein ACRDTA_14490, partial [Pseudonocardiaceae bacterium]
RVASAAVDPAARTQSERVLSRARQFRRAVPVGAPPGLLRDFDDRLRAARAVMDQGGLIEVIEPVAQYRDGLPAESHAEYDDLLSHATNVHRLDSTESTSQ